jgi:hypothetical protein
MHIPDRLLQLIGGAYLLALGVAVFTGIREGWSGQTAPRDISLSTTHPAVPTNLFSATLESDDKPEFRRYRSDRWLLGFGDKICHTTGSLLLHINMGIQTPDSPARRGLFPLFLEGALAETGLRMSFKGIPIEKVDAELNCIATTILDTPLTQLKHYAGLLELDDNARSEALSNKAVQMVEGARGAKRHFGAAYILLRTMVLVMVSDR